MSRTAGGAFHHDGVPGALDDEHLPVLEQLHRHARPLTLMTGSWSPTMMAVGCITRRAMSHTSRSNMLKVWLSDVSSSHTCAEGRMTFLKNHGLYS
ncbi:MAG: hypothetical protein U0641_13410 [Anaerolineae bacterium]